MSGKTWAFEDFVQGAIIPLGHKVVSASEIIGFAGEFDAQPMHLDEEAGRASILGGLSASGWHSCAIYMRMLCDGMLLDSTSQGSPGIDYVKWRKPVLAGDRLAGQTTVLACRPSQSRPSLGIVTFRSELFNQRSELVMELENSILFLRRDAAG